MKKKNIKEYRRCTTCEFNFHGKCANSYYGMSIKDIYKNVGKERRIAINKF